jgi:hypothetical protein
MEFSLKSPIEERFSPSYSRISLGYRSIGGEGDGVGEEEGDGKGVCDDEGEGLGEEGEVGEGEGEGEGWGLFGMVCQ